MTEERPFECAMCGEAYAARGDRIECCEPVLADEDRFNFAEMRTPETRPDGGVQLREGESRDRIAHCHGNARMLRDHGVEPGGGDA